MAKLTIKQEKFCQAHWETGNASEAYRQAYNTKTMKDATVNRSAFDLTENPKIAARLEEIKQIHMDRHIVTVDSITAELEEHRLLAVIDKQLGAANAASMGKGKLHGLVTDKSKVTLEDERENTEALDAVQAILHPEEATKH